MPRIIKKVQLNEVIFQVDVEAPLISRKGKAGQFVIVMIDEKSERVPLTLADIKPEDGAITLVYQVVGKSTLQLSSLDVGDEIRHVVGPLGKPADVQNYGRVVLIGGGCGVAPVFAQAKAFKEAGNEVISIIGFRNESLIFWKDKMESVSDKVILCTDDGSAGYGGFTTNALSELIEKESMINRVIAIGPLIMMENVVKVTRPHGIPTIVSLNALMVDGTGMCGSCRVSTSKGIKFSCVDGPDMDGFDIDFTELKRRNRKYKALEEISLQHYKETCHCMEGHSQNNKDVEKCE
ncbi:MAG: sulfide/dihydroorotate dehydrogenase-like FAD/NAD-binding protein [Promethearchaeota archaeon]